MWLGIALFALLFVTFVVFVNWKRCQTKYKYNLVKNCLLTQHPIVFIHGKKSLFYFFKYWNFMPQFLKDHGYEVVELSLAWRKQNLREREIKNFIDVCERHEMGLHIIGDMSSFKDLIFIKKLNSPTIKTCTVVADKAVQSASGSLQVLKLEPSHEQSSKASWLQRTFVMLHNLVVLRSPGLRPSTVGLTSLSALSTVAGALLSHAISLAEIDARCSH